MAISPVDVIEPNSNSRKHEWAGMLRSAVFPLFLLSFVSVVSGSQPATQPLVMTAPFFMEGGGISSSISIINVSGQRLDATLTAFGLDGNRIGNTPVSVDAHDVKTLQLAGLLKQWSSSASAGSIELTPSSQEAGLAAEVAIDGAWNGTGVHLEESFRAAGSVADRSFRAVAAAASGPPAVVLWNRDAAPQTVTMRCLSEAAAAASAQVSVPARHAVIARGCLAAGVSPDPGSLFGAAASGNSSSAGIEVAGDGPAGSLSILGFALHPAGDGAEAASIRFEPVSTLHSSDAAFTGVPVGRSALLPGPVFEPKIALANFGATPARVSLVYATASSGRTPGREVANLTVPPGASRTVAVPALGGDPNHRNSFVLRSSAAPGTLVASLVSADPSGGRGLMSISGAARARPSNAGAGRWSLANGDSTTLVLFNPTDAPHTTTVHIGALGVLWAKNYDLAPMETKSIDVRQLIDDTEPDMRGLRIPSEATQGQIAWFTPNAGEGAGRLIVSNPNSPHAVTPDYEIYIVLCGVSLAPDTDTFDFESIGILGPIIPFYCVAISPSACSGTSSGPGSAAYAWSSGNPGIAPISGSSTSASASFYGAYPGQASATCQAKTNTCTETCGGTNSVAVPMVLRVNPASATLSQQAPSVDLEVSAYLGPVEPALGPFTMTVGLVPTIPKAIKLQEGFNTASASSAAVYTNGAPVTLPQYTVQLSPQNTGTGTVYYGASSVVSKLPANATVNCAGTSNVPNCTQTINVTVK